MLFGGNHRRGTTTRTPQTRTTVVHNTKGDFLVSETTGGLPTAKMHHHHHRSDEEATTRRRSSPRTTTTTTTNAERLWELQRELAKELIFSENDTASKEKRGAPRERRKGRIRKEEEEEKNSKIIRNDELREDESASTSSSQGDFRAMMEHTLASSIRTGASNGSAIYAYGSMFNHSCAPNVNVAWPERNHLDEFVANENIKHGEQLTIAYIHSHEHWSLYVLNPLAQFQEAFGLLYDCPRRASQSTYSCGAPRRPRCAVGRTRPAARTWESCAVA